MGNFTLEKIKRMTGGKPREEERKKSNKIDYLFNLFHFKDRCMMMDGILAAD